MLVKALMARGGGSDVSDVPLPAMLPARYGWLARAGESIEPLAAVQGHFKKGGGARPLTLRTG